MILNIVLLILGIVVVLKSADWLTDGSVALAERMGISQMVIGLTIVALGTSMPEFCVSLVSAIKGTSDLAVGNVVGSNIFNSMLIVGCAAMVAPMTIPKTTVRKDIPFALIASIVLFMMIVNGDEADISRLEAGILVLMLAIYMFFTLKNAKDTTAVGTEKKEFMNPWRAIAFLLLGLVGLVLGSNVFVDNASALARVLGVSDAVIGLTVVAGGTSMPELATSIVAARKGNSGIAIGNVLGSNVFNILFILGVTGVISPMSINGITSLDLSMMIISMILLWLFSYTKFTIERWEGFVLTAMFVGYMVKLL